MDHGTARRPSPRLQQRHLLRPSSDMHEQRHWCRGIGNNLKPPNLVASSTPLYPLFDLTCTPCSLPALLSPAPCDAAMRAIPALPDIRAIRTADAWPMASLPTLTGTWMRSVQPQIEISVRNFIPKFCCFFFAQLFFWATLACFLISPPLLRLLDFHPSPSSCRLMLLLPPQAQVCSQ